MPIRVVYQPSWWLRAELEFDESAEVPPDPGLDADTLERLGAICVQAGMSPTASLWRTVCGAPVETDGVSVMTSLARVLQPGISEVGDGNHTDVLLS